MGLSSRRHPRSWALGGRAGFLIVSIPMRKYADAVTLLGPALDLFRAPYVGSGWWCRWPTAIPFIAIGILCWHFHRQNKRIKLISRGKYEFIEDARRLLGKPAIPWRGSMARYLEDVDTDEALRFYRKRGG